MESDLSGEDSADSFGGVATGSATVSFCVFVETGRGLRLRVGRGEGVAEASGEAGSGAAFSPVAEFVSEGFCLVRLLRVRVCASDAGIEDAASDPAGFTLRQRVEEAGGASVTDVSCGSVEEPSATWRGFSESGGNSSKLMRLVLLIVHFKVDRLSPLPGEC